MLGDADEAEDAAQETFLRAYAQLRSYDATRSFKTWLFSIANHYCIDCPRKHRLTWLSIDDKQVDEHPALRAPTPTPEEAIVQHETSLRMYVELDKLAPEYRSAVVMRYWYDFSYEEIAGAAGASVSAVKSRLHRARKAMAEKLIAGSTGVPASARLASSTAAHG